MDNQDYIIFEPKISITGLAKDMNTSRHTLLRYFNDNNIEYGRSKNNKISFLNHRMSKTVLETNFKNKVISFHNMKGGVGKTTTAINVACCANALGAKVLYIDADPQGNSSIALTKNIKYKPKNPKILRDIFFDKKITDLSECIIPISDGLDLIYSNLDNGRLDISAQIQMAHYNKIFKKKFKSIESNYDAIIIDLPPNLGFTVNASYAYSDLVVVPITTDTFSVSGLSVIKENIKTMFEENDVSVNYKTLFNKYNGTHAVANTIVNETILDEHKKGCCISMVIPNTQDISNALSQGYSVFNDPRIKVNSKNEYSAITKEIFDFELRRRKIK